MKEQQVVMWGHANVKQVATQLYNTSYPPFSCEHSCFRPKKKWSIPVYSMVQPVVHFKLVILNLDDIATFYFNVPLNCFLLLEIRKETLTFKKTPKI